MRFTASTVAFTALALATTARAQFNYTIAVGRDQVTGLNGVGFSPSRYVHSRSSHNPVSASAAPETDDTPDTLLRTPRRTVTDRGGVVIFALLEGELVARPGS